MKKLIISLTVLAITTIACAQENKYPEAYKAVLEAADAAASPSPVSSPLIAMPADGPAAEVLKAGGIPVTVGTFHNFEDARSLAASIDGFVLTDSFASAVAAESGSDRPALLLLKALIDRNVPILGTCPALEAISTGVMRQTPYFKDIDGLVRKAATYRRAKAFMAGHFCMDTHSDLPGSFKRGGSVGKRQTRQINIQKMNESGLDAEVLVAYIGQGELDEKAHREAVAKIDASIDGIYAEVGKYSDYCGIARTAEEAYALRESGRKAFFIGLENAYGLGLDLANVKKFAKRGVTYVTLSHMYDNAVCHSSSHSADTTKGLTDFGREVVKELNKYGVVVDVSHTSEGTFWDVYNLSKAPFVCSHSGASAVYRHNRNLTDRQLRALAEKNGVIQVYIVPDYMEKKANWGKVSVEHSVKHILHCIEVAGIDHVGIGSDFDGGGGGWGENGANDLINVTMLLMEAGLSNGDLAKLWGGNYLRVLTEAQALATEKIF